MLDVYKRQILRHIVAGLLRQRGYVPEHRRQLIRKAPEIPFQQGVLLFIPVKACLLYTSKRAKANREKHFSDEPIDYLLELLSHDDGYPSDHFVLYADELSCVVHSETLYKALCSLPEKQRKVLLFDFWYAWTEGEIAKRMEVTTRTVYNLRQRAFKAIKTFYEQGSSEP